MHTRTRTQQHPLPILPPPVPLLNPSTPPLPGGLQALRFGEACAKVENSARQSGAGLMANVLEELNAQIEAKEAEIREAERWELVEHFVDDVVDGKVVGQQRKLESVLVGATAQRVELQSLLKRRRVLLGQPEEAATTADSPVEGK